MPFYNRYNTKLCLFKQQLTLHIQDVNEEIDRKDSIKKATTTKCKITDELMQKPSFYVFLRSLLIDITRQPQFKTSKQRVD